MIPRRLLVALLLAAGTTALVPAALAQEAGTRADAVVIGLAEAPEARRDDPRAKVYVIDHVKPGTTIRRKLRVANETAVATDVLLYPGAARVQRDAFTILERGVENAVTRWARVEPAQVRLEPGQVADATLVIAVPRDAPNGEVYGAALAETPPRPQAGSQIAIATRVGVRIYLSVGEGSEPTSDFEITTLQGGRDDEGRPTVSAAVRNTGGRALDMAGELRLLDGPGGIAAGPFPVQVGTTLAPGESAPVLATLDPELPRGPWVARVALRSGTLERTAEAKVTFPAATERGTRGRQVTATTVGEPGRAIAIPLAIAALALAAAALLWQQLRRRGANAPA